jgi:signal transduction histidine kinase
MVVDAATWGRVQAKVRDARTAYTAFLILVAAAYVSVFAYSVPDLNPGRVVALLVLGALFTFLGTYGEAYCEVKDSLATSIAYFGVQLPLAWFIAWFSGGYGLVWLLPMVLTSHAVTLLPQLGVYVVGAFVVLPAIIMELLRGNVTAALTVGPSLLAAVVFVAVFTRIATNEELARREVERLLAELGEANRKLRAYAVQAEELATTKERNRLAREIHDGLGHYLTAVHVQIRAARAVMGQDVERAEDALSKAERLSREALEDVRRSVAALRVSPVEGQPLPDALAPLIEGARTSGLDVGFEVTGSPRSLSPPAELTLYRVAQEGLTNVRKHAGASHVEVALAYRDDEVVLTVQDDGQGAAAPEGGFGLLGLRERVQLLGGEMDVTTSPGRGFNLKVQVPE